MLIVDLTATLPTVGAWERRNHRPDCIVIHHSVTRDNYPVESIARYHISKGEPGIAYHYVVTGAGEVYQCNDDMSFTWHGHDGNSGLGVCLLGDFTETPPQGVQLRAASELVALLKARHGITRIIGHREAGRAQTACPGKAFTDDMVHGLGESMTDWTRYPRPPDDTGAGVHGGANAYHPLGDNDGLIPGMLAELKRMGLRWLKLLDMDGSSYNACRMVLEAGMMPVVRLYRERPYPGVLSEKQRAAAADLVRVGVRYFERGNEPNVDWEWQEGRWPGYVWGAWTDATFNQLAGDWLQDARYLAGLGGLVALDAPSPGGHYDDVLFWQNIIRALKRLGATGLIQQSAWLSVHNAGLNHPPDYPDDTRNQQDHPGVTIHGSIPGEPPSSPSNCIRKYEKVFAVAQAELGFELPVLCTEGGWWVGNAADPRYPELTVAEASKRQADTLRSMRTAPAYLLAQMPWLLGNRKLANLAQGFERDAWDRWPGWGNCPANEPERLPLYADLLANPCQRREVIVPTPPTPPPPPTPPVDPDAFTAAELSDCRAVAALLPATMKAADERGYVWRNEIARAAEDYVYGICYDPAAKRYVALKMERHTWTVVAEAAL